MTCCSLNNSLPTKSSYSSNKELEQKIKILTTCLTLFGKPNIYIYAGETILDLNPMCRYVP